MFKLLHPYAESILPPKQIFRGQEEWDWDLEPSLLRIKKVSNGNYQWHNIEIFLLQEFFRQADTYLTDKIEIPFRMRMLAQHYGVPTRLLDWTTNPLVALYFATYNLDKDCDSSLYITETEKGLTGGVDSVQEHEINNHDFVRLVPTSFDNRILAQSAVFTTHKLPDKFIKYIPYEKRESDNSFTKIIKLRIPKENKHRIRFELEMLGINHARLFPGLDGIGHNIRWMVSRQNHWELIIKDWHKFNH